MAGYIGADGKYRKGTPPKSLANDISSQWKDWDHDNQRRRYAADIVQPFIDGKPNPEFVEVYRGEVASTYFNQEQIDAADRNLGGIA